MRWNTLSILDFAILSELSYFDEPQFTTSTNQSDHVTMQNMLDELFPDLDLVHIKPAEKGEDQKTGSFEGAHPIYLEVTSERLGLTVVAVRGTDVGRLHDFLGTLIHLETALDRLDVWKPLSLTLSLCFSLRGCQVVRRARPHLVALLYLSAYENIF
jgi:hypothetical protein